MPFKYCYNRAYYGDRGWQGMRDGWPGHTHDLFTVRARARRKTFFVVVLLQDNLPIDHRIVHVRRAEMDGLG